ncbi:hypothetical protein LCGC14_0818620 [marine sediment metagenome]
MQDYTFDDLWQIKTPWFEPPNHRRGGWSGVVKYSLPVDNTKTDVFIKRQENHSTKTWAHPFSGIPTFQKEYNNIVKLRAKAIPTLEAIFFGVAKSRAILVTKELKGYSSLENIDPTNLTTDERKQLLSVTARLLRKLHHHRFQHNSLYPKHLFAKQTSSGWKVRLIDLEKMKRTLFYKQAMKRDLSTLNRHASSAWSVADKVYFLQRYFDEFTLSTKSKHIIYKLATSKKAKKH